MCVSVCGWQSACAARALLCVCRSACLCGLRAVLCIGGCWPTVLSYCVYCPPSRLTTNPMKSLTFTRACPLVQDSGVDNAASLTAHEMMERVTQQVTAARYMPQAPLGCTRLPHTAHRTQHTAHSTPHTAHCTALYSWHVRASCSRCCEPLHVCTRVGPRACARMHTCDVC